MPDRYRNSSTGARNNSKHRVSVKRVLDGVLGVFTHVNPFNPYITAVCARSRQSPPLYAGEDRGTERFTVTRLLAPSWAVMELGFKPHAVCLPSPCSLSL